MPVAALAGAVPLHLGTLHPVEQALVLLLAFGPFVVLGFVVRHQRRREAQDPADAGDHAGDHAPGADDRQR